MIWYSGNHKRSWLQSVVLVEDATMEDLEQLAEQTQSTAAAAQACAVDEQRRGFTKWAEEL